MPQRGRHDNEGAGDQSPLCDVTVVDTLANTHLLQQAAARGLLAREAAQRETAKYAATASVMNTVHLTFAVKAVYRTGAVGAACSHAHRRSHSRSHSTHTAAHTHRQTDSTNRPSSVDWAAIRSLVPTTLRPPAPLCIMASLPHSPSVRTRTRVEPMGGLSNAALHPLAQAVQPRSTAALQVARLRSAPTCSTRSPSPCSAVLAWR